MSTRTAAEESDADAAHAHPLYRQIYLRVRDAILGGTLRPGQRLSSSRALASQMGVGRNTVLSAYAQLEAEGYISARLGSGHYVSPLLPTAKPAKPRATRAAEPDPAAGPAKVRNPLDHVPESLRRPIPPVPFRINLPELETFPIDTWARLQAAVLREARRDGGLPELLGEAGAQGDAMLRRAIADHVAIARGVRGGADAVIITAGAQHAMDILLRVLTQPGDGVGLEDPCFPGALAAARAASCRIVPMPVDEQGADPGGHGAEASDVRVLLVCPSKQFPLGVTMSLPRRLALIDRARRAGAWIIEDDYDSEYRFDGKPIPSLQGLDGGRQVIYVGTFSKVLFPSLRLGFIVCPPALVGPVTAARAISGRHGSTLEQRVLARFIDEGHLARHVRRMKTLYRERQDVLLEACGRHLGERLRLERAQSGLQTIAWLPPGTDDRAAAAAARALGIEVAPLSRFCVHTPRPPAIVLGFGAFPAERIRAAVRRLAQVPIEALPPRRHRRRPA